MPAPLDTVTRLTLIAQASNAPLEHSLASVCVEYERRILTELWDRSGHLQWQLQMKQEEEDRRQIEIAGLQKTLNESQDTIRTLQAQLDQANRDVGIISDTLLTMHESYRERLERLDNLEATVQEINPLRQRIAELETELNVVYQSRSWRLIKRYWRTMDSPGLGPLLKRMRRTMIKLRHRSSNSE
ncbi:MAG TPA: hypothetical protein DD856_10510 [Sulfobacillus sp.]|nr:hypothetical protein [Sulfobacillus sp.]